MPRSFLQYKKGPDLNVAPHPVFVATPHDTDGHYAYPSLIFIKVQQLQILF